MRTVAILAALAALVFARQAAAQPNVLLIVTDNQRADELERMPTVRAEVAAKGVSFDRSFSVDPLCCPARATILTGTWPHRHRVYRNNGVWSGMARFDHAQTVAAWLQAAGCRTGWFGKYFNNYGGTWVPPGWDRWVAYSAPDTGYFDYTLNEDGIRLPFGWAPEECATDVLAAEADRFIRETPAGQPWFAALIAFAPHLPAKPAPRHEGVCADLELPRPPSLNEWNTRDKPSWARGDARQDTATLADLWRRRCERLFAVDEAVARLLATLAETGEVENTLIVFTSDNGYLLGEHRQVGKSMPYEESTRVPLIIRYDPLTGGVARTESRLVGNVDLAPTISELAGVTVEGWYEGRSLVPLLAGEDVPWRHDLLVEHFIGRRSYNRGLSPPTFCQIRGQRYSYVQYATGEEEVYNLSRDPYQLRNVAGTRWQRRHLVGFRWKARRLCRPSPPGMTPLSG